MNRLIISTKYPDTVLALLTSYGLIDNVSTTTISMPPGRLELPYPDDAISQALSFWFAMATGCGLVESYQLETQEGLSAYFINLPVSELQVGDIFCPPDGNPPGTVTRICRDPLTASNNYPLVMFEYEGNLCGKHICDIRQDQIVRVYRGTLEDANSEWTAKYVTKDIQS